MVASRRIPVESDVRRRINRRYSPISVAFLLSLSGCGESSGPKPTVTWEGTVSSAATGAPISGAAVEVVDGSGFVGITKASGTTDAQGHYTLSHQGCFPNPYLEASASGYLGDDKPIACRAGTVSVDIALTPSP